MKIKISLILISILVFSSFFVPPLYAATLYVPDDYPNIQAAITASNNGDTVLVSAGTYNESINFQGKAITLISTDGPVVTTIDANGLSSVVTFNSSEGPASVLNGFTLINGNINTLTINGGGIDVQGASPTILNCIITNNSSAYTGGGIVLANSSANISNCKVISNHSGYYGGGIYYLTSTPNITKTEIFDNNSQRGGGIYGVDSHSTITNCIIKNNIGSILGGGAAFAWRHFVETSSSVNIRNTIFSNNSSNYSGGLGLSDTAAVIKNCTIADNTAVQKGGGLSLTSYNSDSDASVINTIIWNNQAPIGPEINLELTANSELVVSYSDVQDGWEGVGNIDADPLFIDPENNNYHEKNFASPIIDKGDPVDDYSQEPYYNGKRINIGAYGNTPEAARTLRGGGGGILPRKIPTDDGPPLY